MAQVQRQHPMSLPLPQTDLQGWQWHRPGPAGEWPVQIDTKKASRWGDAVWGSENMDVVSLELRSSLLPLGNTKTRFALLSLTRSLDLRSSLLPLGNTKTRFALLSLTRSLLTPLLHNTA